MAEKKSTRTRLDPTTRQRRIYSAVIIVLSACVVLSMILQMIAR